MEQIVGNQPILHQCSSITSRIQSSPIGCDHSGMITKNRKNIPLIFHFCRFLKITWNLGDAKVYIQKTPLISGHFNNVFSHEFIFFGLFLFSSLTDWRCKTNIDECESNPCQFNGTCIDGINGYNCSCIPGITGDNCEINIDDCDPNPCGPGQCIDLINR